MAANDAVGAPLHGIVGEQEPSPAELSDTSVDSTTETEVTGTTKTEKAAYGA